MTTLSLATFTTKMNNLREIATEAMRAEFGEVNDANWTTAVNVAIDMSNLIEANPAHYKTWRNLRSSKA